MSSPPGSPSSVDQAPQRAAGAASLAGIRIRPGRAANRAAEDAAPDRKPGDITLLLSRVAAKPLIAEVNGAASGKERPRGSPATPPDGPIDATVRDAPDAEIAESEDAAAASPEADRRRHGHGARRPSDIQGYWTRLRGGRRWPAWDDLDAGMIAQVWPNSFLLTCEASGAGGRGAPVVAQARRVGSDPPAPGSADDLPITHAVVEWIRSIGAEVAASGLPARETDRFETGRGSISLRLHALPLSDDQTRVDRVLCHVARASG
jgi:hypothetical protein